MQVRQLRVRYENKTGKDHANVVRLPHRTNVSWHHLIITVTSQWARWLFKSPASRLFTQVYSGADQRKFEAPRHWPEENSPMTGEFPAQRASNADKNSIWCRRHDKFQTQIWVSSMEGKFYVLFISYTYVDTIRQGTITNCYSMKVALFHQSLACHPNKKHINYGHDGLGPYCICCDNCCLPVIACLMVFTACGLFGLVKICLLLKKFNTEKT